MLKRTFIAALAIALVMSALAFPTGNAHAHRNTTAVPGTWLSAILIQNVSTGDATVKIDFYDKDGTNKATYSVPQALSGGKSVTIIVPAQVSSLAQGQYSAVVSSTAKVIASVQTSSVDSPSAPWTAFAYEGVDSTAAAKKLFFPAEMKGYYNFDSEIVIQNTDDANATTLSAEFYDAAGNKLGTTVDLGTLGANRAITWPLSDTKFAGLPSGNANGLFGAVITSSATNIAGITNVWATTPTAKTASYNAFTAGSTTLYAPNLMNNYYGFGSALSIQNIDQSATATGTVTYSNGKTTDFSLKPNAAVSLYQPANTALPSGNATGSFSAKVVATSGSIVGIVGFSQPPELNNNVAKGDYAYYNCPSVASAQVNIPNILSNYYSFFSGISVQNTGAQDTVITLTYENGKTWTSDTVPANGIANFLHLPGYAFKNGSTNPLADGTSISAVASSSNNMPLVAVVQHNTEAKLSTFKAAKRPSDYLHVFTATPKQ